MKLIALYLPQFHPIAENDLWWGQGFTEWTNTRKSVPLYEGHVQPKEPLDDNYYDLTMPSAQKWQAELAKKYGIFGFCYYHYWFKGKRLLEKPYQQMLELGEPDFPFCLSWANEAWTRRWDGGSHHILMPQDYGDESDWEAHFYELLPAFRDHRYIRMNDKPLFIIYRPEEIPNCSSMLVFWNQLAKLNGLPGIYFVRTLGGFSLPWLEGFDASMEFEPHYTFAHSDSRYLWNYIKIQEQEHLVIDYDYVWNSIIHRSHRRSQNKVIPGAFVNWDNTPRLGARGQSCIGTAPHKFEWYLTRQIQRASKLYDSEFLFINAWNEWGEGAFLEPDKIHRFRYLEAVRNALDHNGYSNG